MVIKTFDDKGRLVASDSDPETVKWLIKQAMRVKYCDPKTCNTFYCEDKKLDHWDLQLRLGWAEHQFLEGIGCMLEMTVMHEPPFRQTFSFIYNDKKVLTLVGESDLIGKITPKR